LYEGVVRGCTRGCKGVHGACKGVQLEECKGVSEGV